MDALARGEQIVILRKGGISEARGGFQVEHPQFLLFPTLFHQQRESVVPHAQRRFDEIASNFPSARTLRVKLYAKVVDWRRLEVLADAERLRGQHIWRDELIVERFDWGKSKNIFAIAVRVFRLPNPVELPMLPSYEGCKSWIELEHDVDVSHAAPILSDSEFPAKLSHFRAALEAANK